jgi:transcriptional regulator with XRE-family HTH domain
MDHPLFDARDAERVRLALRSLGGGTLIAALGVELEAALRGSDDAVGAYVRDYRRLSGCLLAEAHRMRPELVAATANGLAPVDAAGRPAPVLAAALEHAAAEAPFTAWAGRFELGDAAALDLVARVRALVGARTLAPPVGAPRVAVDDLTARRFIRRVRYHLGHPDDEPPLRRVMEAFGLSKTELAALFGVRRQAIDQWQRRGVPAERQEKVATLLAVADLLERKLKPGRLPGVARRPADAYGGETMLTMIAADRHRELLDSVRASFDWATAA